MSRELRFDFPGLRVGIAEYEDGPTGCTVFHLPPGGAACSMDIRGGSPGTIGNYEWAHAVCFAGGSLYGLEAACGVAAELMAMRGNTVGWEDVELVLGAIVYDFGRRDNAIYPDAELGRQALRAAEEGDLPARAARRRALGHRREDVRARAGRVLRPGRRVPRGRADEDRRLHGRERVRRDRRPRGHGRPRPLRRGPGPAVAARRRPRGAAADRRRRGTRRSRSSSRTSS